MLCYSIQQFDIGYNWVDVMFHLMVLTMVMLASFLFLLVQDVFKVSGITNIKELENHMDFKFSSTGWDNWNYSNTYIFVERRA